MKIAHGKRPRLRTDEGVGIGYLRFLAQEEE